jgi:hypothetical protein
VSEKKEKEKKRTKERKKEEEERRTAAGKDEESKRGKKREFFSAASRLLHLERAIPLSPFLSLLLSKSPPLSAPFSLFLKSYWLLSMSVCQGRNEKEGFSKNDGCRKRIGGEK